MAQKFGNGRWVKEGFLDNRVHGLVVGRIILAVWGPVEMCLKGDFKGEIAGKAIAFHNSRFEDEDLAGQALGDFEIPQVGEVSLISFDPHPNLPPHPYVEWFSIRRNHYRFELNPEDAWIVSEQEVLELDAQSAAIRSSLADQLRSTRERADSDWV